jgi:hypothetical protein
MTLHIPGYQDDLYDWGMMNVEADTLAKCYTQGLISFPLTLLNTTGTLVCMVQREKTVIHLAINL